MTKRDKASIYVDAQQLLYTLYDAQFEMDKRDRPVLAVRLLDHTEQIIANFSLAFKSDDKLPYVDTMLADEMGLSYTRYADDCVIVVQNKEAALALLPLVRKKYAEVGCTMHPKKFYCQHVNKGLRFLGVHIKFERIYVDNRVVRNAAARIREFNRCRNRFRHLGNFIATLNSYFGRMKNRNEYSNIRRLWESIDAGWYRYVEMDWDRLCVVAREECSHHRYNMKLFKTITHYERT